MLVVNLLRIDFRFFVGLFHDEDAREQTGVGRTTQSIALPCFVARRGRTFAAAAAATAARVGRTSVEGLFEVVVKIPNEFTQFVFVAEFLFDEDTLLIAVRSDVHFGELDLQRCVREASRIRNGSYGDAVVGGVDRIGHVVVGRLVLKVEGWCLPVAMLLSASHLIRSPSVRIVILVGHVVERVRTGARGWDRGERLMGHGKTVEVAREIQILTALIGNMPGLIEERMAGHEEVRLLLLLLWRRAAVGESLQWSVERLVKHARALSYWRADARCPNERNEHLY
jgi:hypothetical protein